MNLLIKGGILIDPSQDLNERQDLLIQDGRIHSLGENLPVPPGTEVLDASGLHVAPGFIDAHVHFRDPGFPEKEDLLSGAASALAGGFTSVICMPNTKPAIDSVETVKYIQDRAEETACRIYMMGAITRGLSGGARSSYEELKREGVVGITDDGLTVMDAGVLLAAMKEARALGLPVSSHCEEAGLTFDRSINQGAVARDLGLEGVPSLAEELIIQRDILLAREADAALHIQHISSARGVEMVRRAKAEGLKVTAEAAPHHFSLTEEAVRTRGTNAKMSPPLRTEEDRKAIMAGLADGTIDIIATDHAPHTAADKGDNLVTGANGIVGLETSLALGISHLVETGILTLSELVKKMSCGPAELFGLAGGSLKKGASADVVLFDPSVEWTVDPEAFFSRGRNTPFGGETLRGRVEKTLVAGKVVFSR